MTDPPTYPVRHRLRLPDYDYAAAGYYFVTVCTHDRQPLFGMVQGGTMHLSPAGQMVLDVWQHLPQYSPGMKLDAVMVLPDHLHGIVVLDPPDDTRGASPISLPRIMQRFKSYTTTQYGKRSQTEGWPAIGGKLWQRSYFERVIRNERELDTAREYIIHNVAKWEAEQAHRHPDNRR